MDQDAGAVALGRVHDVLPVVTVLDALRRIGDLLQGVPGSRWRLNVLTVLWYLLHPMVLGGLRLQPRIRCLA